MARGFKTGGRKKGSLNKATREEDAPIRIESLSDYQLEMLIKRLQRG
jgi:hypothetical protein